MIRKSMHAYLTKAFMNYDSPTIIVDGANDHALVQVSKILFPVVVV